MQFIVRYQYSPRLVKAIAKKTLQHDDDDDDDDDDDEDDDDDDDDIITTPLQCSLASF